MSIVFDISAPSSTSKLILSPDIKGSPRSEASEIISVSRQSAKQLTIAI